MRRRFAWPISFLDWVSRGQTAVAIAKACGVSGVVASLGIAAAWRDTATGGLIVVGAVVFIICLVAIWISLDVRKRHGWFVGGSDDVIGHARVARIGWHPAFNGLIVRAASLKEETLRNVALVLETLDWSASDDRYIPAEEIPEGTLPLRLTGGSATWRHGENVDYPLLLVVGDGRPVIQLHLSTKGGVTQFPVSRIGTWRARFRLTSDAAVQRASLRFKWDGYELFPLDD